MYEAYCDMMKLLVKKRVYPYEYMNDWEKFNEEQLPPIEEFCSKLSDEGISEEKYNHAQDVWKRFDCKNMGHYHDLYLRTDVLLLADVLGNFRKTCLSKYKLDPAHYHTSLGLSC